MPEELIAALDVVAIVVSVALLVLVGGAVLWLAVNGGAP
jgi:hypothetical protein